MIHDVLPVNSYCGNNSCTQFDFNFYIENEQQLDVFLIKKDSSREKLTLNVDYSINEVKNKNGSFINFPLEGSSYPLLGEDERISIELSLQFVQEIQYNNSSLLNLESLEYSFDYLTRLIQILQRRIDLCARVEEGLNKTPKEIMNEILGTYSFCTNILEQMNNLTIKAKEHCDYIENNYSLLEFIDRIDPVKQELEKFLYKDFTNCTIPYVVTQYCNESKDRCYRKWSDGFLEMFIFIRPSEFEMTAQTVFLPTSFTTDIYNIFPSVIDSQYSNSAVRITKTLADAFSWQTVSDGSSVVVDKIAFYANGY